MSTYTAQSAPYMDFTDDEIKEQLEKFGYKNVPKDRLVAFKRDLEHLVESERSKTNSEIGSDTGSEVNSKNIYDQRTSLHFTKLSIDDKKSDEDDSKIDNSEPQKTYAINRNIFQNTYSVNHDMKACPTYKIDVKNAVKIPTGNTCRLTEDESTSCFVSDIEHDDPIIFKPSCMKRKTLRKNDGIRSIDESFTESESDDVVDRINKRLANLRAKAYNNENDHNFQIRPKSAPPQSNPSQKIFYDVPNYNRPKSVIRPMNINPHNRNILKSDPVNKHQMYADIWKRQKAPGEKQHKDLRWNIRELMLYKDDVVKKSHKVFTGNDYQIPSDKHRKNLRWQIRQELALGMVPLPKSK